MTGEGPAAGTALAPAPPARRTGLQLGPPVTAGTATRTELLAAAAQAAPQESREPLDRALLEHLDAGERSGAAQVLSYEPARPMRRMSTTVLEDPGKPGSRRVILRGELDAVLRAAGTGEDTRLFMRVNAAAESRRGFRALAVAVSEPAEKGRGPSFRFLGFVPVRQGVGKGFRGGGATERERWVRVPVWSAPLRWLHWLDLAAVLTLILTGLFIANPILGSASAGATRPGFLMGYVRLVHYSVAWGWIALGVVRVYMLFFSRDRYVRWPVLWPLKSRSDLVNLRRTLSSYLLIHPDEAPTYVAHNPLQQLAYTGVYVIALVQVLTGLALYGLYDIHARFWSGFAWIDNLYGIPAVRLVHYMTMWVFVLFIPLHIYLVIRADNVERDGGLSAMVGGSVWIRRDSAPVDDPSL